MAQPSDRATLVAFGAAVRAARVARGYSQEAFAEVAGLHRTYVGGIERGERNPAVLNIRRIARALDVSASTLMAEMERRLDRD